MNYKGIGGFKKGMSGNPNGRINKKSEPQVICFSLNPSEDKTPIINADYTNKEYVFFGVNNLFPQELIKYYDNISFHRKAINKIVKFIVGEGLAFEGDEVRAKDFVTKVIRDEVNFLNKLAFDIYVFGGAYINTIWDKGGQLNQLANRDFSTIRSSKLDKEGKLNSFWHSSSWQVSTLKTDFSGKFAVYKPKQIPVFDPDKIKDKLAKENGQLYRIANNLGIAGKIYYSEPSYMACINWLDIAAKISNFHKANLDNGMVSSTHIHLFEDLSDSKKREKVVNGIKKDFTGTDKAGTVVVTWSTTDELKPILTPIPTTNTHEVFMFLKTETDKEINNAHEIPPILSGFETKTGMGGQSLGIRESLQLFQNTVIRSYQQQIESALQYLMSINGINTKVSIKNSSPISFMISEATMLKTMWINEIRTEILGLEPLKDGDKFAETNKPLI